MSRHRGRRDQLARAALAPLVASGTAKCWRCDELIDPLDEWDAGHLEDLATGGAPAGRRLPEHRRCNRVAGAQLGAQLRRSRRRRLDEWRRFFGWRCPWTPRECPFSLPRLPAF